VLNPEYLPTVYHLALTCHKTGRLERALELLGRILQWRKDDRMALESRGLVFFDLGECEQSLADLQLANQLEQAPETFFYIGRALVHLNKIKEAIDSFQKAIFLGISAPKVLNWISQAYFRDSNYEKAIYYIDLAIEREPENVEFLVQKSIVSTQVGKFKVSPLHSLKFAGIDRAPHALAGAAARGGGDLLPSRGRVLQVPPVQPGRR